MRAQVIADYVARWDQIIAGFLDGGLSVPPDLARWFAAYDGKGAGAVMLRAFHEPWVGPFDAVTCRGVMLGLNPGIAHLGFQGRDGIFAKEIRQLGSYSAWAATWPYLRDPWEAKIGPNKFPRSRLRFLRQWLDDDRLSESAMVTVEMYPWHSKSVTAKLAVDPAVAREWVLEPVRALDAPVFAFGAPWFELLTKVGLTRTLTLGVGGTRYGSTVPSRTVAVFENDGLRVIAEKHAGSAGPPRASEVELLRAALPAS